MHLYDVSAYHISTLGQSLILCNPYLSLAYLQFIHSSYLFIYKWDIFNESVGSPETIRWHQHPAKVSFANQAKDLAVITQRFAGQTDPNPCNYGDPCSAILGESFRSLNLTERLFFVF